MLLTVIFWGVAPILEKSGLGSVDEFTALFIRSTAIFIILLIFFSASGRLSSLSKVSLKTIVLFSLSGICAGLLGMWTYFKVLKDNPSSRIVPLVATYPLITALLGVFILKEGFSWSKTIGTLLIVGGILLVK